MDKRACIYIRIGWLFVAAFALFLTSTYIMQQRFQNIGMCAPTRMDGEDPGIMIYDSLNPTIFCIPLPPAKPLSKEELAPKVLPDDKKTGV